MSSVLLRRLGLGLLLLAFTFYAFRLAPPHDPPGASFGDLARGHGAARNPAVYAIFCLLGVLPLMYWALLFPDARGQRVWAWPFALGMMALGSFALLPYLILRRPYPGTAPGRPDRLAHWFGGRPFAVFVTLGLIALLLWGILRGDWVDAIRWFRVSNGVNVMGVDFLLLTLLFPTLLRDDFARRGLSEESPLARLALAVPLLGPAIYLIFRPAEKSGPRSGTSRAARLTRREP